ncbi:MAG TPA: uroporphyrinogen decarboxylase family protein [Methanomassiliicoccales archaeon]|nr:uroporphyrinogen decarboxylase family protein [Methanomassiliicoccales archaeon]
MNSNERFLAALRLQGADRVPLLYQHLGASSHLQKALGLQVMAGFDDPEAFAKLSLEAHRQFGFDNVMAGWGDLMTEAHAHGATWKFTDPRFYPRPVAYVPMSKAMEIQPVDPSKDRHWSVPLKAAKIMLERLHGEVEVVGACVSPSLIASETVGMETLMMAYFQQEDAVHSMLRAIVESCKAYGERASETGLGTVFVDDSGAGMEMVSLDMYQKFDGGYLSTVMSHWKRFGISTIIHNDSAQPFYEAQAELGPAALHVHLKAVDVSKFFSDLKGRLCVIAGIDHTDLLFKKPPNDVEAEVKRVLGLWGRDPGLILAPGCELPYKTPLDNITRMREAVVKYGSI